MKIMTTAIILWVHVRFSLSFWFTSSQISTFASDHIHCECLWVNFSIINNWLQKCGSPRKLLEGLKTWISKSMCSIVKSECIYVIYAVLLLDVGENWKVSPFNCPSLEKQFMDFCIYETSVLLDHMKFEVFFSFWKTIPKFIKSKFRIFISIMW